MHRIYLWVPPEERKAAESHGAKWDNETKRWYIDADQSQTDFAKWLLVEDERESLDDPVFNIVCDQAFVAAASVPCQKCSSITQVICIYCASGSASGEPLTQFAISHISGVDEDLRQQLSAWPNFQQAEQGSFVNRCHNCEARIDDLYLHSEPGDPFFHIPGIPADSVELTPLTGTIRLSGDEHFQVD